MTQTLTALSTQTAPFVVCPECAGVGSFGPGFVWTQDEINEDPEGFVETQTMLKMGVFNEPCATCKGLRVVPEWTEVDYLDGTVVRTTAEEAWEEEVEYRAEVAAERRFGC